MKKFFVLIISSICLLSNAQERAIVDGSGVDLYIGKKSAPTILYIPGCNGLDRVGKTYQEFHKEKFKETWPEANFVISQYVNDYTNGQTNGRCDWQGDDSRLKGKQSYDQADHTIKLAEWFKQQPWSNGTVHLFGFSWGGRVGVWLPGDYRGKNNDFKSEALIWPDCRPVHKIRAGELHTPTRIWSTENDPLSIPKNCPSYYKDPNNLLTLTLLPGDTHSWFTGPHISSFTRWWPVQNVYVKHEYNEQWTNQTFKEWKEWVDQL
jgi:dienelactone hydrolase